MYKFYIVSVTLNILNGQPVLINHGSIACFILGKIMNTNHLNTSFPTNLSVENFCLLNQLTPSRFVEVCTGLNSNMELIVRNFIQNSYPELLISSGDKVQSFVEQVILSTAHATLILNTLDTEEDKASKTAHRSADTLMNSSIGAEAIKAISEDIKTVYIKHFPSVLMDTDTNKQKFYQLIETDVISLINSCEYAKAFLASGLSNEAFISPLSGFNDFYNSMVQLPENIRAKAIDFYTKHQQSA